MPRQFRGIAAAFAVSVLTMVPMASVTMLLTADGAIAQGETSNAASQTRGAPDQTATSGGIIARSISRLADIVSFKNRPVRSDGRNRSIGKLNPFKKQPSRERPGLLAASPVEPAQVSRAELPQTTTNFLGGIAVLLTPEAGADSIAFESVAGTIPPAAPDNDLGWSASLSGTTEGGALAGGGATGLLDPLMIGKGTGEKTVVVLDF